MERQGEEGGLALERDGAPARPHTADGTLWETVGHVGGSGPSWRHPLWAEAGSQAAAPFPSSGGRESASSPSGKTQLVRGGDAGPVGRRCREGEDGLGPKDGGKRWGSR